MKTKKAYWPTGVNMMSTLSPNGSITDRRIQRNKCIYSLNLSPDKAITPRKSVEKKTALMLQSDVSIPKGPSGQGCIN